MSTEKNKIDYDSGKTKKEDYFDEIIPNINDNISKNGGFFVDDSFPANINSVVNSNNPLIKQWKNYVQ